MRGGGTGGRSTRLVPPISLGQIVSNENCGIRAISAGLKIKTSTEQGAGQQWVDCEL